MKMFARKDPWYVAGLAFECTDCGTCCAGPGEGYVWLTPARIAEIAKHLDEPESQVRRKYVRKILNRFSLVERADNKDCIFLTTAADGGRKCRIYPVRPTQCRTWPFWADNLKSPDDWAMAGLRCAGINRGQLHDRDEIKSKRKATGH